MVKQTEPVTTGTAAPATTAYPAPINTSPAASPYTADARFARALTIIRPIQLVLSIIVLGLTAWIVYFYQNSCFGYYYCVKYNAPGMIGFNLFNSIWTLLVCIYLIIAAARPATHQPIAVLVIDVLSAVFWFAGFISVAVYAGDAGAWIGVAVVGAVEWALFTVTSVFTGMGFKRTGVQNTATPMQQYPEQGIAQHA